MSTKLEQASSCSQTATASATSLSGPKISMFANKTGFVIPKNKLAGSLVPVFRVGKKGGSDSLNEDSTKQVQRKTKWGPDLTQDTTVRKARALAYQSRVDQITQLLSSRSLEGEGSKDSLATSPAKDHELSDHHPNDESVRSLELERREAIGEILKLNPSYKPPAGYKPVPKEAKIPVPIKEHPGYNFIGLIFGPAHKQLEKETGAQVKVYGTKADTGEKVEVTSGENDSGAYEEMYVQVSAETYEKVDAAVALIELLVTPVSVTPATTKASGDGETISVEATPSPTTPPVVNQGMAQPGVATQPAQLQGHFQPYQGQWFPGPTSQNPVPPFPGSVNSGISSASLVNNPPQVSPSPTNLSNASSPFVPPQGMQDGFGSVPRNPFVHSSPQAPLMRQPYMPSTHFGQIGGLRHPIPALGSTPPQSNMILPQFSRGQPSPTGFPQVVRPVMSSLPQSVPPTAYPDRPLTPAGNSPGWSQSPWNNQTGQGPSNMIAMAPPTVSPQGSHHLASRPMGVSAAPHIDVFGGHNLAPQASGPAPSARMPPPLHPSSGSTPAHFLNHSLSSGQPVIPSLSSNPVPGSSLNINSTRPTSFVTPKPVQPSNDFTFQPHHPHNPASQVVSRPAGLFGSQELSHSNQMMRPHVRPAIDNPNPPPVVQGFQRPQLMNQISQSGPPISLDFARGPAGPLPQFRHSTFSNQGIASPSGPQMQPMNFRPAPNHVGSFPPRGNSMPQLNNPTAILRPQNFEASSNLFFRHSRPASISSAAHQIYDPFSPTSVPRHPHPVGNPAMAEKQESDPEYEDLMASVGVK